MNENLIETLIVGVEVINGEEIATNRSKTRKQMKNIMKYELDVVGNEEEKLKWTSIGNLNEENTLFSVIDRDRKIRKNQYMSDRPPFIKATIKDKKIIRLEFYFGHDKLEKIYDFRNENYKNSEMEDYIDEIRFEKDYLVEMVGMKEVHDNMVKAEINYLKIRNTETIEEHRINLAINIQNYLLNLVKDME